LFAQDTIGAMLRSWGTLIAEAVQVSVDCKLLEKMNREKERESEGEIYILEGYHPFESV